MSEHAHTPGPWDAHCAKFKSDSGWDWGIRATIGNKGYCIAEAFEVVAADMKTPVEANARLIAAAPDLLAALCKLEEAEDHHANCEECEGMGVPELCKVCFPLFDDARCMRRAAIAKASEPEWTSK